MVTNSVLNNGLSFTTNTVTIDKDDLIYNKPISNLATCCNSNSSDIMTFYDADKRYERKVEEKDIVVYDVKVFPNLDNPRVVQCRIKYAREINITYKNGIKDSTPIYRAETCKEDKFEFDKGLYICIAKFLDTDKKLTPNGVERKADELKCQKRYFELVEKTMKDFYKKLKEDAEKKQKELEEAKRIEHKKQKAIEKKKRRLERKRQEQVQLIADAIVLASKMMKEGE